MFPRQFARVNEVQNVGLARAHPSRAQQSNAVSQRRRSASVAHTRRTVMVSNVGPSVAVAHRAAVLSRVMSRRVADTASSPVRWKMEIDNGCVKGISSLLELGKQ